MYEVRNDDANKKAPLYRGAALEKVPSTEK
jgi:hypothetical protein